MALLLMPLGSCDMWPAVPGDFSFKCFILPNPGVNLSHILFHSKVIK